MGVLKRHDEKMTEIQEKILEIYKYINNICDNNNIPIYAIGGTCIGAIRHRGFIPWDDDLDIAVPIEYFEILIERLKDELPSHMEVYLPEDHPGYISMFIKVVNKNTTFIEREYVNSTMDYKGVFVDIMPISGLPQNEMNREKYIKKILKLIKKNQSMRFQGEVEKFCCFKELYKKIYKFILKKRYNTNYFEEKYYQILKKYPLFKSDYTGYVWSNALPELIFPSCWFTESISVPFEDTEINVPIGYHSYLTQQFGDYMEIPHKENQETHAGFVDLGTPYGEYQKGKKKIGYKY